MKTKVSTNFVQLNLIFLLSFLLLFVTTCAVPVSPSFIGYCSISSSVVQFANILETEFLIIGTSVRRTMILGRIDLASLLRTLSKICKFSVLAFREH